MSDSKQPVQSEALAHLRVQIDSIDQQLLSLLNQRAHVAEQVGEIKKAEGIRQAKILAAEGEAQAIKLVNEAAELYFIGNAQVLADCVALARQLPDELPGQPPAQGHGPP